MTCGYAAVGRQEDGKKEGQEDGKQQGQEDGKGNHAAAKPGQGAARGISCLPV